MRQSRFRQVRNSDLSRWLVELAKAARTLLRADPAPTLEEARHLEHLLIRHLSSRPAEPHHGQPAVEQRMLALARRLPTQRRRWAANYWPAELLEFDFTLAWSRLAVLAGGAGLGFMVGLTDPHLPDLRPASSVIAESDLSMIVFEADPLSGMRP